MSVTEESAGRFAAFGALRYRPYRRVWVAFLVTQTGQWMQITARAVLVFAITGSAGALGLIYLASYSPQLVFSLVGGALADRFSRRVLVMWSAGLQGAFAILFGVLAATDTATFANLMALSFVAGVAQTAMMPAQLALLPALVPPSELHNAISLQSTAISVTRILGPLAAGAIIPLWGVDVAFYLNAVGFLATIRAWYRTRVEQPVDEEAQKTLSAIVEGWRFIRRTPVVRTPLLMQAWLSAIGLVYQPLGVAYATQVLAGGREDLGSTYYGVIQAAIGIGSIIGILSLTQPGKRHPARVALGTGMSFGVALTALGFTSHIVLGVVITFLIGAFHFANATLMQTLMQYASPELVRGRVMSVFQMAFVGLFPFTSALFGWVADAAGIPFTFASTGVLILTFSAVLLRWRHHFRVEPPADLQAAVAVEREDAPVVSPRRPG